LEIEAHLKTHGIHISEKKVRKMWQQPQQETKKNSRKTSQREYVIELIEVGIICKYTKMLLNYISSRTDGVRLVAFLEEKKKPL
jgi:hypothetical protein